MKKYVVPLMIMALLVAGCARKGTPDGAGVPPPEITYGKVLTEERETTIREFIAVFEESGMFGYYTMVENKGALELWLDVGEEPITSDAVKGLTDGMIRELADLFNGELPLRLTALQKGAGDKIERFGTSVFSPATKEVTYEPLS